MARMTDVQITSALSGTTPEALTPSVLQNIVTEVKIPNAPAHDPLLAYQEGDLVYQANKVYRCKADIAAKAFAAADWDQVGGGGGIDDWVKGTTYNQGDHVFNNLGLWRCVVATTTEEPGVFQPGSKLGAAVPNLLFGGRSPIVVTGVGGDHITVKGGRIPPATNAALGDEIVFSTGSFRGTWHITKILPGGLDDGTPMDVEAARSTGTAPGGTDRPASMNLNTYPRGPQAFSTDWREVGGVPAITEYSPTQSYQQGDVVRFGGGMFTAANARVPGPIDTTNWMQTQPMIWGMEDILPGQLYFYDGDIWEANKAIPKGTAFDGEQGRIHNHPGVFKFDVKCTYQNGDIVNTGGRLWKAISTAKAGGQPGNARTGGSWIEFKSA